MVSTRHHPRAYPPPETPSKDSNDGDSIASGSTRATRSVGGKSRSRTSTSPGPESPSTAVGKSSSSGTSTRSRGRASASGPGTWEHTPSHLTLIWLLLSLPLVIWDTGYIFGRPHTFPGGWLHSPIWSPYALYYKTDYMYGALQWEAGNGFTAAQGFLNIIETVMYYGYLYIVWAHGEEQVERRVTRSGRSSVGKLEGRGAPSAKLVGWFGEARVLGGRAAGAAVLIGFSASLMTLSKTVLYWLNEYFSNWQNIGHNSALDLFLLWILPNGLWLIFPTYMLYAFGADILEGLVIANGAPVPNAIATKRE